MPSVSVREDWKETSAVELREVAPGSFIFEVPGSLPGDVCREMVRRFEACGPEQYAGRVGHHAALDTSVKRSTDLVMSGKAHWKDLDGALFRSLVAALGCADAPSSVLRRALQGRRVRDAAYRARRVLPLAHRRRQPRAQPPPARGDLVPERRRGTGRRDRVPPPVGEGEAGGREAPVLSPVLDPRASRGCPPNAGRSTSRRPGWCSRNEASPSSAKISPIREARARRWSGVSACGTCAKLPARWTTTIRVTDSSPVNRVQHFRARCR